MNAQTERVEGLVSGHDEEDTQKGKYLTFTLGNELYGIGISHVTEIIGIQKITEVPDMPDYVRGVINLRGLVIPLVDVRIRFHMQERAFDERTCVVVVRINETSIGLVVDTVSEVVSIPDDRVSPPPRISQNTASRYIQGIGKSGEHVTILLDVNKLLFEEELEMIEDIDL